MWYGPIAHLVRAPHLQCGGKEFESPWVHHTSPLRGFAWQANIRYFLVSLDEPKICIVKCAPRSPPEADEVGQAELKGSCISF